MKTIANVFIGLVLFVAMLSVIYASGQFRPLNNPEQLINVPREGSEIPRVNLSAGFVPVVAKKCVRGGHPVEVRGVGPSWIVIGPIGGVNVQGGSGSVTRDPKGGNRDDDGCVTREFENPIPPEIAASARRQGEILVRIFGEEKPVNPLSFNPLLWSHDAGQPGFFPVDGDWRTEDFMIIDDTKGGK